VAPMNASKKREKIFLNDDDMAPNLCGAYYPTTDKTVGRKNKWSEKSKNFGYRT
jgi:hypothetical protein